MQRGTVREHERRGDGEIDARRDRYDRGGVDERFLREATAVNGSREDRIAGLDMRNALAHFLHDASEFPAW